MNRSLDDRTGTVDLIYERGKEKTLRPARFRKTSHMNGLRIAGQLTRRLLTRHLLTRDPLTRCLLTICLLKLCLPSLCSADQIAFGLYNPSTNALQIEIDITLGPIANWQFTIADVQVASASGGISEEKNFLVLPATFGNGTAVTGFNQGQQIPNGVHVLTELVLECPPECDGLEICLANAGLFNSSGQLIPLTIGPCLVLADSTPFIRGDFNSDGEVNIADAILGLRSLFVPGSSAPACDKSADANDDGDFSIADSITILQALFVPGSLPIPDPHICAADPTSDDLFCKFSGCP